MWSLIKLGAGVLCLSVGFVIVVGAVILGVGMAFGDCGGDPESKK